MELKFIWVKQYRIIKETGFNFNHSGDHRFLYQDGILHLEPNKKGPIDFGPKITGVTAIAGENGSGKSSLCEISLQTTATLANGGFGYDLPFTGIVCYGIHIFYQRDLKLQNTEELVGAGYTVEAFDESPFEQMDWEWKHSFHMGGFIYYSNVLDLRSGFSALNLANISSQNLISEDYKYSTSYTPFSERKENVSYRDSSDPISIYFREQGYRFTKFYVNYPELIPFKKPATFIIKSAYSGNNRFLNLRTFEDYNIRGPFERIESNLFDDICRKYNTNYDTELEITKETSKTIIYQLYKLNLIKLIGISLKKMPDFEKSWKFIYKDEYPRGLFKNLKEIKRLVQHYRKIIDNSEVYSGKFKPFSMSHMYEDTSDWRFFLVENMYYPNTQENIKHLKYFINLEESILRITEGSIQRITNYNLSPQLSSGESSYLTFFSRLLNVIQRYESGYDKKKNLILFIDEAEIGFHPQWQKHYFKWLIDFLNNYTFDYSFQLILTTHSPYLLSDLPSQNVLLLQKSDDGRTEIVAPDIFKSFGSNIHELLANNFFLKNGFMGEFAKLKIETLIGFLKDKNQNYTPKSALELIATIGDELIANRLQDMYNEKFGAHIDIQNDEEYRKWLESEMTRLNLKQ